jgi:hypothetical protein
LIRLCVSRRQLLRERQRAEDALAHRGQLVDLLIDRLQVRLELLDLFVEVHGGLCVCARSDSEYG